MAQRMMYKRDLYPSNWPAISIRIKTIAGWKCEYCGAVTGAGLFRLETHHIDGNPQNNADSNLIALCALHHNRVHGMMQQPRTKAEVLQRLSQPGRQLYFR